MGNSCPTAEKVAEGVDLSERIVIVTGASSGLGIETVRVLALCKAKVIMACRNVEKGEQVATELRKANAAANLAVMRCDLSSFRSVRQFVEEFKASHSKLDILVNNAGVMALPSYQEGEDGFEMQMTVNHLGHFLLTTSLIECLKNAKSSRIVNVSSLAHKRGRLDIKMDPKIWREKYSAWSAYGDSKLANILFTLELRRRYPEIQSFAVHPGVITTNLHASNTWAKLGYTILNPVLRSIACGAASQVFCATTTVLDSSNPKDLYVADCKPTEPTALARDKNLADQLWKLSERLCQTQNQEQHEQEKKKQPEQEKNQAQQEPEQEKKQEQQQQPEQQENQQEQK